MDRIGTIQQFLPAVEQQGDRRSELDVFDEATGHGTPPVTVDRGVP